MTDSSSQPRPSGGEQQLKLDTSVSHPARIWNYWLGGKDNYPVDREIGSEYAKIFPGIYDIARAEREFLVRAVTHLAGDAGIRQFLDVGTGLPTANNTHQVAQSVAPESRIVYMDNDPLVLLHAEALLVGSPEGVTDYLNADLRDPEAILAQATQKLDFTQPIALMLLGVLGLVADADDPFGIVDRLVGALPSGSYLVFCDGTGEGEVEEDGEAYEKANDFWNEVGSAPYHLRSAEDIARFFNGVELLEPGIVSAPLWRPNPAHFGAPAEVNLLAGVGRKP